MMKEIRQEQTRIERLSPNEFLPDPENDETGHTSEKVFEYKMKTR